MVKTAFLSDERLLLHDTGNSHPERPARLTAVLNHLEQQPWYQELLTLRATPCSDNWLYSVHDKALIRRAEQTCLSGQSYLDSPDVQVNTHSFNTALLAAGGVLKLVDLVISARGAVVFDSVLEFFGGHFCSLPNQGRLPLQVN